MNNVLLISPTWVNIHIDIVDGLKKLGYQVEFIEEYNFSSDPYKIRGRKHALSLREAEELKKTYWQTKLNGTQTVFDYLLVVDGCGVNGFLFEELRRRNPNIYCVNYLYDTTYWTYHFEKCFSYYDRVVSFDISDAENHKIDLLPIYWVDNEKKSESCCAYEIFGYGAYSPERLLFFSQITDIAQELGVSCFAKIYHREINNLLLYRLYLVGRKLMGLPSLISASEYSSEIVSHDLIPPEKFRDMINAADVVLDTKVQNQDGLTARFMWALGLGKKIITTNDSAAKFDFCSKEQVLIIKGGIVGECEKNLIAEFIKAPLKIPAGATNKIECLKINNWLKNLLKNKNIAGFSV